MHEIYNINKFLFFSSSSVKRLKPLEWKSRIRTEKIEIPTATTAAGLVRRSHSIQFRNSKNECGSKRATIGCCCCCWYLPPSLDDANQQVHGCCCRQMTVIAVEYFTCVCLTTFFHFSSCIALSFVCFRVFFSLLLSLFIRYTVELEAIKS